MRRGAAGRLARARREGTEPLPRRSGAVARPLVALVALALLAPLGCAHDRLAWRLPDGSRGDPERLADDVYDCEEYTAIADEDGPFKKFGGARAWGGWGNPTFEFCMNRRGWILTRVPKGSADRG